VNLHSVAVRVISAINPQQPVSIRYSLGTSTQLADGTLVPAYSSPPTPMLGQLQSLQYRDLIQIQALNLNGTRRSVYLWGDNEGLVRLNSLGGDLITFIPKQGNIPANSTWLVATMAENWPQDGWCRCICTLQNSQ
jgi:hypothetical protein